MAYLAIVSLIWAFSFGLIGSTLTGVDSQVVATIRLGLALLLLAPFFRWKGLSKGDSWRLLVIGAIQFGVMYTTYIQAFKHLPSHLIALFSILTPVYVVLINDLRQKHFHPRYLVVALLSILGAAVIRYKSGEIDQVWLGFGLMQVAGLAFAFGQVAYRDWKLEKPEIKDQHCFALLYLGGFLFALIGATITTDWTSLTITPVQWQALLYLGIVASGCGFFLWNKGATRSNPGALASFNNAVVPLGVLCSLFIFGEGKNMSVDTYLRLLIGASLIALAIAFARPIAKAS